MACQHKQILGVNAKCSDCFDGSFNGMSIQGYVPYDLNIGGGDYITFELCVECGQIQGDWPITDVLKLVFVAQEGEKEE